MSHGRIFAPVKLLYMLAFTACVALPAEKKVRLEELPAPVQASVREQTRSATLVGISTEKEKGKTLYEVETKVNGKRRDVLLDAAGTVVETEEEVGMDVIPAAARAALEKKALRGTIAKVEKVTTGSVVTYEATIKTKAGKTVEYAVTPDGKSRKED